VKLSEFRHSEATLQIQEQTSRWVRLVFMMTRQLEKSWSSVISALMKQQAGLS